MMARKKKHIAITVGATIAALVLSGCSSTDSSSEATSDESPTTEVTEEVAPAELTFVLASAVLAPKEEVAFYAVAQELGYFAEENLEVTTVNSEGSVAAVQAIASGSADLTAADAGAIIGGAQSNVGVKAIGGLVQNWPWAIATLKDSSITSPEDLKGTNIGVISLASGSAPFARAFVNAFGLDAEADVNLLPVGVGAQAQAALESGQVDSLALYTQAYAALENAGVELNYFENPSEFDGLRSITFAASTEAVEADPDVYERFLRAAYKGMLFTAVNPEAAMRIGYKVFPQLLDGSSVEERLADDLNSLNAWVATATPREGNPEDFTDWGAIPDSDWEATQEYMILAGQLEAKQEIGAIWTDSLLSGANNFDSAAVVQQARDFTP